MQLRPQVEIKLVFKESLGMYITTKKCGDDMTRFDRELSKEKGRDQMMQLVDITNQEQVDRQTPSDCFSL